MKLLEEALIQLTPCKLVIFWLQNLYSSFICRRLGMLCHDKDDSLDL